ncbi:MAG: hypothetical protein Kow0027_17620 [Saprospiraceae bacterium]
MVAVTVMVSDGSGFGLENSMSLANKNMSAASTIPGPSRGPSSPRQPSVSNALKIVLYVGLGTIPVNATE